MKRIFTSIIGIPLLVYIILFLPKIYFFFLITLVILWSLFEFYSITDKKSFSKKFLINIPVAIIFILTFTTGSLFNIISLILIFIISCFIFSLLTYKNFKKEFINIAKFLVANFYITLFTCFSILILNNFKSGREYLMLLLVIAWSTDSFAYIIGKNFGKNKLYPILSPNKTVEGALGGIFFSIISALIFNFFITKIPFLKCLILITIVSVFCVLGDLFESMIKRIYNVKDSGNILPGHGGLLDRIDSLFLSSPIFYILLKNTL